MVFFGFHLSAMAPPKYEKIKIGKYSNIVGEIARMHWFAL
jgi:hypothetical protein